MSSIMQELQSRMGGSPSVAGGDQYAGDPSGGLPPELMSAIQNGSPAEDQGVEQDEVELLTGIIDSIHQFMQSAADEDDKAIAATCLAQFQKIRAKDQAEMDGAMKGQASPRLIRKTAAAVGGPGGGGY